MTTLLGRWCGIFLLALFLSGCGSADERKASYVAKAKEFIQDENLPKARVALRNALKIDPKDPQVFFLSGQVSEKEADWPGALNLYARAVELDATHRKAMGRLGRWYFAAQETRELQGLSDKVFARDPQDALGHILQACMWFLDGEKSKALAKADSLLTRNPTDPNILLMLAAIFSANQELEKAKLILEWGLTAQDDHVDLMNHLATISIEMKTFDKAEAIYLQLLAREPHVFKHRDSLAGLYRHLGKSDKALALLREGVTRDPNNEQGWKSLVRYAERSQREGLLQEALQALPHSRSLRFLLGAHYEQNQDYQKARDVFEAAAAEEEASGQSLKAEVELAKLDFSQQHQQLGEARLPSVLEEHRHQFDAHSALARLLARDGQLEKAQQNLEARLQMVPTHMEALWNLFQLKLSKRQWSQADDVITRLKNAGGSPYQIDLATGLLAVGRQQWDQAVQAFSRAQHANLNALPPLVALIKVYLVRKHPEQAQAYLEKIIAEHPDQAFASGLLGAVLWQLKDKPAALSAYARQTRVNPTWVEAWKDWASLQWSQGKKTQAFDILKTALTHNPNSLVLLNSLASFYQADGQVDLAIGQYEAVLRHNAADLMAANNLAYLLADKRGDSQSLEKALSLTQNFETKTQNPFLLDTLAWVFYKKGLHKEATRVLKKALAKAPDHAVINYHFALMTLQAGDRVTAKKHLEKAVQRSSELENVEVVRRLLAEIPI